MIIPLVLALAACASGEVKEGLGPAEPSPVVQVSVTPDSASVGAGGVIPFAAQARHEDGSQTTASVTWSATGGTISGGGAFTAGGAAGTYRVVAAEQAGSLADTATVVVTSAQLVGITISPSAPTVFTGGTQQFTVSGQWSNGATTAPAVTYAATGGTITSGGLYTAGGTPGTYRVVATQQGGSLADTSQVTVATAPPNGMFFNSSEPGGNGSNPNYLMADDFEDGDWYSKDCDQAESSGGLLQTDGWCGTIYANPITPAGAVSPQGRGFRGSNYAASSGYHTGAVGGRNMATHDFVARGLNEAYFRVVFQPQTDYDGGHEKMFDFIIEPGAASMVGLCYNYFGSETIRCIPYLHQDDGVQGQANGWMGSNMASTVTMIPGHWYYFEYHIKLNTPGMYNGVSEFWMDDLGTDGRGGPATPTLRSRYTNVKYRDTGTEATYVTLNGIWIENWADEATRGTMYYDNVVASRTFIGFVP